MVKRSRMYSCRYLGYTRKNAEDETVEAGSLCHQESGFMQEIAQEVRLCLHPFRLWFMKSATVCCEADFCSFRMHVCSI